MARKNYFKNVAKARRESPVGEQSVSLRKSKDLSRPDHKPKGLRKEIKKEKIKRDKS